MQGTLTRKDQITQVAQNMFREKGYSATSMRDLAKIIGIEPASLYSHIKSKEEILQEICCRIAEEFFQAINEAVRRDAPADERLRQAIRSHVKIIVDNRDASAVFFHEWRFLNEPALSEFKRLRTRYEDIFKNILKDGMAFGLFKTIDLNFLVYTIFSSMNHLHEWYKEGGSMGAGKIGDELAEVVLNGIKTNS